MKYLKGSRLLRSKWRPFDERRDHDHCEFCGDKFNETEIEAGYCTEDFDKWICEECFADFMETFEWVLVEEASTEG
jgi:hypothetical protein